MTEASTYYDRDCQPITVETWARLSEDMTYRLIERTVISATVDVVTMWHGADLPDPWRRPPHIFGSIVRTRQPGTGEFAYAGEVTSPTQEEARQAHRMLVAIVQEGLGE